MQSKDAVTWLLLIWIGIEIANQQPGGGGMADPADRTQCSYGFGGHMQSSVTAPFWIRNFSNNPQPFTFQAS
jgi:hypothetical protein